VKSAEAALDSAAVVIVVGDGLAAHAVLAVLRHTLAERRTSTALLVVGDGAAWRVESAAAEGDAQAHVFDSSGPIDGPGGALARALEVVRRLSQDQQQQQQSASAPATGADLIFDCATADPSVTPRRAAALASFIVRATRPTAASCRSRHPQRRSLIRRRGGPPRRAATTSSSGTAGAARV